MTIKQVSSSATFVGRSMAGRMTSPSRSVLLTVTAPVGTRAALVRTRGTLLDRPFGDSESRSTLVRRDTTFTWKRELDHLLLPPRDVRVWLPPDYSSDTARAHPTLYCHDGQHVIARPGLWRAPMRSWHVDRAIETLSASGALEATPVVVLIDNCHRDGRNRLGDIDVAGAPLLRRRWLEYSSEGVLGERYLNWVCDDLKPLVDTHFNTNPSAAHTHAMGSSMGGCAAFNSVWRRPDAFGNAACLSPVFRPPLIDDVASRGSDHLLADGRSPRLWIDNGGDVGGRRVSPVPISLDDALNAGWWWLDTSLQPGVDAMCRALREQGVPFRYHREPGGRHNEAAWAARVERPLRHLFGAADEVDLGI